MPRALKKAVYFGTREKKQSLLEHTTNKFNESKREGVTLPAEAKEDGGEGRCRRGTPWRAVNALRLVLQ